MHVTLNTGHVRESPRSEIRHDLVTMLQPLARSLGGPIPGQRGWSVAFTRESRDVLYTVSLTVDLDGEQRAVPIVTCGLARVDPGRLWGALDDTLYASSGQRSPATAPTTTPWLGVVLHQTANLATPEDMGWIGDFERCLAWAIIDESVQ